MLEGLHKRASGLALFVSKCNGEHSVAITFTMESGEKRVITSSTGVPKGDTLGPTLLCMPLGSAPEKMRLSVVYERKNVELFPYMDGRGKVLH